MKDDTIKYCGSIVRVICDGRCEKAFGINGRPKILLSDDPDDFEWLSDDEVGIAPCDTGVYEGGIGKPVNSDFFPNKWCVRECERCTMSFPASSDVPRSFERRVSNKE